MRVGVPPTCPEQEYFAHLRPFSDKMHCDSKLPLVRRINLGLSAGKGLSHDSAWIMLLRVCGSLNLSKASQFGSTLAPPRLPHFKHCLRHDKK